MILPLLILVLAALLQAVFGWPVVVLVLLVLAWTQPVSLALWGGFVAGVVLAVAVGWGLGMVSAEFLGIVIGVWLARRFLGIERAMGGTELTVRR